jgi:hypothetical protein
VWTAYLVVTMTFFLRGVRRRGGAPSPAAAARDKQPA